MFKCICAYNKCLALSFKTHTQLSLVRILLHEIDTASCYRLTYPDICVQIDIEPFISNKTIKVNA